MQATAWAPRQQQQQVSWQPQQQQQVAWQPQPQQQVAWQPQQQVAWQPQQPQVAWQQPVPQYQQYQQPVYQQPQQPYLQQQPAQQLQFQQYQQPPQFPQQQPVYQQQQQQVPVQSPGQPQLDQKVYQQYMQFMHHATAAQFKPVKLYVLLNDPTSVACVQAVRSNSDLDRQVEVVDASQVQNRPSWLKGVPSLIDDKRQFFIGSDCVAWIRYQASQTLAGVNETNGTAQIMPGAPAAVDGTAGLTGSLGKKTFYPCRRRPAAPQGKSLTKKNLLSLSQKHDQKCAKAH